MVAPATPLDPVPALVADEQKCTLFQPVLIELRNHRLDTDDLRDILCSELGEAHCFKSGSAERDFPATTPDYYSI